MKKDAIVVSHLEKSFKVYPDKGSSLKEKLLFLKRNAYDRRQVLKDISFTVSPGEAVALIGRNGCGKSTLLKILTRIIYPDRGEVDIQGKVSSLIELGAGFHPDMTGRENIYVNASIFGLQKKKIDERLSDIIAFSGLEDYMDVPVRTYSSGMYARLAFAVAIHVSAQVLLIDEILAVGDAAFQRRCFAKMERLKREGTTIVLVSHSMEDIAKYVERIIVMNRGEKMLDGTPREVFAHYRELEKVGLAAPQVTYVMHDLKERGFPVSADATTIEEAADEIMRSFHD